MGVFNLLCSCCLGRPKRYKESLVDYSYVPYGPPVNEIADTSIKAKAIESSQPAKETTPPPNYSVNSLSKVQTIISSAPTNASPTPLPTEIKEEKSEIVARVIKPLPQRRDKRTSAVEQKSLLQTPLPPSLYEEAVEPVTQQVKDEKNEEAGFSKPVQLFVFPKLNVNVESTAAVASSTTMTATETAASSIVLNANPAGTATIFDRLAASKPHPVPTNAPLTPTPVADPTPIPTPAPVPEATPPSPPKISNPFLTLALRPARHTPNTPINNTVPLSTAKTVVPRPAPPTTTPPRPKPLPSSSTSRTTPGRLCPKCSHSNNLLTTHAQNLNHLRPYRLCSNTACKSWNGFADTRGLDARQQCNCTPSYPMRLVAMNRTDESGRRQAFWSCQYKACSAWGVCVDDAGDERWFGRGEVQAMVAEGRI